MTIGEKILMLRKQLGLSQTQLAQKTGLANSTVCDIEKNRLTPSIKTLKKIANALNVPVASFFMDSNYATDETTSTGTEGR